MKGMLIMRIDKYLKITRIIKRRTVANEACDAGKIEVNGKVVRASYDVKVGDVIAVNMGQRPLKVEVLNVTEYATKENAAENYRVIE
jgi:ribosomal 50S subunit-recycling heat shock protein